MTRYDWPLSEDAIEGDDPIARAAHNARLLGRFAPAAAPARPSATSASSVPAAPAAAPPSGTGPVWVPLGPTTVLNGQAAGSPRVAGRVRDVWASPNGLRVYAAATGGGVWFSADGGNTWKPLGPWASTTLVHPNRAGTTLSTGCLHVTFHDPDDGSEDEVVVGTGELSPARQGVPGGWIGGVGLLRARGPAKAAAIADPWTVVATNLEGFGVYRIAQDPDHADGYVVASSLGLFFHSGASTANEEWARAGAAPFNVTGDGDNLAEQVITDVVWAPGHGGQPARLFVAWHGRGVWMSEHGVAGPFHPVDLPGSVAGRITLACAASDPGVVYVLSGQPRLWRIEVADGGPVAKPVDRVPTALCGKPDHDQSDYDLSLAVNPGHADVVVLGGSGARNADDDWEAALIRCAVSAQGDHYTLNFTMANDANHSAQGKTIAHDPTWIGYGVHADVQAVRYCPTPASLDLYVGCDGGVFRSRVAADHDADRDGTFVSLNSGLAVLEAGYVASHPVNDTCLAAGTQDNGMLVRVGDTVWAMKGYGDGGGVLFNPDDPEHLLWQYEGATWYAGGNWTPPVWRRSTANHRVDSEDEEDRNSSFYSNPAVIKRADGGLRVVIGTNRVWLTDDWAKSGVKQNTWATLPSHDDPRKNGNDDTSADRQYKGDDGKIVALRWMSPQRLLALMHKAVLIYREGVDGKWIVDRVSHKDTKCGTTTNDDISSPSDFLPPVPGAEWSDICVHDPEQGARGSFYVTTTSTRFADKMDTLWWFDGGLKWHSTGLRSQGTEEPAYAVAVDQHPMGERGTVYVGTAGGVWKGELAPGSPPQWTSWTQLGNGLPDAAVQDLAIVHYGDRTLLRAALQSRGVWEFELAAGAPAPKTYLRSWAYDGRRGASSATATHVPWAGFDTGSADDWASSPDVSVRPSPGTMPPTPHFPITEKALNTNALWAFQTALHAVDPACRPTGSWTKAFGRRLEVYRKAHNVGGHPVPANLLQVIDSDVWGQVVDAAHVFAPMWDGREPTEADLLELVQQVYWGAPTQVLSGGLLVDVLVHHRDPRPIDPAAVRVTLLSQELTGGGKPWEAVTLDAPTCTAVRTTLTTSGVGALAAPWAYADAGHITLSPTAGIDAATPRPVTFDVAAPVGTMVLLLAVMSTDDEPVSLPAGSLADLVRSDPHLAARVIRT